MGLYTEYVVPRIVNLACGSPQIDEWRATTCRTLTGTVVEIGFGSGLNVTHYPTTVTLVNAVEPSAVSMKLASRRIRDSTISIHQAGLDGQVLALPDASCDSALVTFTLCTIPDAPLALRELHRVLRPGGELHFLEHGLAPNRRVARWQHRLDPFERRVADGCHLTRDPLELVANAGFEIIWKVQRFAKGPKPWTYFTAGVAKKSSTMP